MAWTLLSLLTVLSLCRCGSDVDAGGEPVFEAPPTLAEKQEFLSLFPLQDETGTEAPAMVPTRKIAPFGAFVAFLGGGKVGFCTSTHLVYGRVVTNAHCIAGSRDPVDYFVVFYDRDGHKRFQAIESFVYVGSPDRDDIAVLGWKEDAEATWDLAGRDVFDTENDRGKFPPELRSVRLWSFDPFKTASFFSNHPNQIGMRFHPRECMASRTRPRVAGYRADGATKPETLSVPGDEQWHLFVDTCDMKPVNGNSGSLLSLSGDFAQKLGVYHWGVAPTADALRTYRSFDYTGNSGQTVRLPNPLPTGEFYGVGTDFQPVLRRHPGLFSSSLPPGQ